MAKKSSDYDDAYSALVTAFTNPAERHVADSHPLAKEVMSSISDKDLHHIANIINNQAMSTHGEPKPRSRTVK